jgi:hypothetical protein
VIRQGRKRTIRDHLAKKLSIAFTLVPFVFCEPSFKSKVPVSARPATLINLMQPMLAVVKARQAPGQIKKGPQMDGDDEH